MPAATTYKCPNCDGELLFDPGAQKFHCEYCDSFFTEGELSGEKVAQENPADSEFNAHAVEYDCPNCGAQVMTDDTTAATFCYYCHNPVVLGGRLSGAFKPDKVIPFRLEREVVGKEFLSWCKKKKFMKRDFFSQAQQEKLTGLYLPFWIVDASTNGDLRALGRKIRTWRSGDMEYTETQTYELIRNADIDFRELPFAALTSSDIDLTQGIYPYDYSKALDFSMPYLSGFQAQKRKLEKKELEPEEQRVLREYTEQLLRGTTSGYSGVTVNQLRTTIHKDRWSYMLLPVWTLTYRYKDKDYYYAMNGQTGKVCGRVPLSVGRLAALFGIVTGAVLAISLLIGGLLL